MDQAGWALGPSSRGFKNHGICRHVVRVVGSDESLYILNWDKEIPLSPHSHLFSSSSTIIPFMLMFCSILFLFSLKTMGYLIT